MKIIASLLASASVVLLATGTATAGESPYNPNGNANSAPKSYAYYCTAQSIDNTTWYITSGVAAEPGTGKYDPTFIGPVGAAWGNYLTSTVGPHKVMYAHCTEGMSAAAQTAWENDSKRTGFAHIVTIDWQYKP